MFSVIKDNSDVMIRQKLNLVFPPDTKPLCTSEARSSQVNRKRLEMRQEERKEERRSQGRYSKTNRLIKTQRRVSSLSEGLFSWLE